jgi:hypothetical protein
MNVAAKFPPVVSAYMQSQARYRWILGPFGSGKSVGSQVEIPRRAEMQRASILDGSKKTRIAVVRETMPQLRDTTMKTWFDWFPNGSLGEYHGMTKTYHIKKNGINCEVIFRALDDEKDVSNLLSIELTGAYLNEFRDIKRVIVEAIDGRLGRYPRMVDGGPTWIGMWGDSNMPDVGSYWYNMLEKKDPEDGKTPKENGYVKFVQPTGMIRTAPGTYVENPHAENLENLPAGYYKNLIQNKTEDYIRMYVMCEYGRSKGGKPIHPMFNRALHVAGQTITPNPANLLLISADFGLTPALVLKQQDALGRVQTFDSIATFDMGLERAIETKLLPLLRTPRYADCTDIFVTGDPSGERGADSDETSCVDIFRRYKRKGLGKVKMAWSNSPVHRQGATDYFLSRLVGLGMPAYQIDPGAVELIEALEGAYMFKKYKDGRPSNEVEKNDASHTGEANEYGDMYYERGGRRKAELKERGVAPVTAQPNPYATPRN